MKNENRYKKVKEKMESNNSWDDLSRDINIDNVRSPDVIAHPTFVPSLPKIDISCELVELLEKHSSESKMLKATGFEDIVFNRNRSITAWHLVNAVVKIGVNDDY